MSSTSLVEFSGSVASECYEYRNSWGGAARIWDALYETYETKKHEYDNWLQAANDGRLWKIWEDDRVDDQERLVYLFTCDNALVQNKDFKTLAEALRHFAVKHPRPEHICHLKAWAKVLEESKAEAMGLHATSVCENPWFGWNEETDESEPYDIAKGERHWFITDRLNDFKSEAADVQASTTKESE
jgi:hypothetical protein